MVRLLARAIGVGIETADMLVNKILSRDLRSNTCGALCWPPPLPERKRQETTGERAC